jgi:hypothetical protein
MANEIAIQNIYDGPTKPLKEIQGGQFNLDFAYSQDASVVDAGIKETIRGVKLSIMAMGIALYRVDVSGLFIDLGFKKFGEYIDHLADESGMARTSLYNWEYIGEAYITHRADLDKIGFSDDDGPTKLPFLGRALENHSKREVFKNIKDMSLREFEKWSKEQLNYNDKKFKSVKIKGTQVFVGKSPIISFADGISPKERHYYEGLLLEGALAAKRNEYAKVYRFYDAGEAQRFDRFYQRELKAIRAKK